MPETLLPLFPLGLVLLPGAPLPLHIFEERYKEMIGEAIANSSEFGVVQAGEGSMVSVGCTATVQQVLQRHEDGQMDIMAVGRRRFGIQDLNKEKSYLRASVSFFDDEDNTPGSAEKQAHALAGLQTMLAVEGQDLHSAKEADSSGRLSFFIGRFVDDLTLKQTLLGMLSETERLDYLIKFFPEYIARRQRIAHVHRVGPMNGHSKQ